LFDNIYKFFTKNIDRKDISVNRDNYFLVNILSCFIIFWLIIFGIIKIFDGDWSEVSINFSTALLIFVLHQIFIRTRKFFFFSYFLFIVINVFLFYLLFTLKTPRILIWFTLIPPLTILLFGRKQGGILAAGLLVLFVFIFFVPITSISIVFDLKIKLTYIATHIFLFLLSYFFNTQYERNLKDLEISKEEAIKANIAKNDFVSKMSHQLRTPLYNIVALEKMISDLNPTNKHKELLDTLIASTNNLVDVVNNIANLPGISISYEKRGKIKFDLFSTLSHIVDSFPSETKKSINFHVNDFENFDQEIIGDPVLVKQLILNILEKIIPFKADKISPTTITVTNLKETSDNIELAFTIETNRITHENITDNGFYNNKQNEQLVDLSISEKLLKTLGRKLEYKEIKEKSLFIFSLEFEKVVYQEAAAIRKEKINLIDSNILIVEDNEINQQIMKLSLIKLVKSVDVAGNGKIALDMFGLNRYDIILMDIQMPIMNGITATKKIREIEKSTNTHTPIIAITANAMLGDKETCLSAGIDDYLSKPYQMEDLLSKMKDLLS
ncbi:MAG: response regulator, partial [Bacteroidales bacterium]|nr:response regulator [Bacteroidales bacterium]